MKTYSELIKLSTFSERFDYLKVYGTVGYETFGHYRYLNQKFYSTPEWKRFRRDIILRDNGCDLAMDGYEIGDKIIIHHINPISIDTILNRESSLMDPENVVCMSMLTHNAIHYNGEIEAGIVERKQNDTIPWR